MLIFFDIDGTLIGEESHVMQESTKRAIQEARKNGHICMINTGRSKKLVGEDITGLTEFDGYIMGCGTMITYRGELLLHKTFSAKEGRAIIDGLRRCGIDAVLEGEKDNFRDSEEGIFTENFREFIHEFDHLGYKSYEEAPGSFDKFYCYAGTAERMQTFMNEFNDRLDVVDRTRGYYEVMPKGYSKASGIQYMAEKLGIPMEQTVAIGDSNNDLPMLRGAHIGIVMGNASDELKKLADYVTTDVDEDGIANALKWLGTI